MSVPNYFWQRSPRPRVAAPLISSASSATPKGPNVKGTRYARLDSRVRGNDDSRLAHGNPNRLDSRVCGNDHPMVSTVDLHSRVYNTLLGRMNAVEFTGGDLRQQMCLVL